MSRAHTHAAYARTWACALVATECSLSRVSEAVSRLGGCLASRRPSANRTHALCMSTARALQQ
eukprot:6180359-Pleurochrysis_carterae.AAC.1